MYNLINLLSVIVFIVVKKLSGGERTSERNFLGSVKNGMKEYERNLADNCKNFSYQGTKAQRHKGKI